jgi:HlyD family secretion protein
MSSQHNELVAHADHEPRVVPALLFPPAQNLNRRTQDKHSYLGFHITMHKAKRIIIGAVVLTSIGAFAIYRTTLAADNSGAILASGTVEATQAELGFQVSGRLETIGVREGDRVTGGAQIASLEQSELLAQRLVAQAQVEANKAMLAELTAGSRREEIAKARASLAVATEKRDLAQRDVERLTPLAEQSLVSRQAFDQQRTQLSMSQGEVAKANEELQILVTGPRAEKIAAQRATLAQAQATVERIDAQLSQTVLKAPFSGTVTVRHREPGEALSPGNPVLTVRNFDDRWVRVYIPGDEVGRLTLGQAASITGDANPDKKYNGTISYIASVAEFTPRNVQSTKDRVKLVYEVRVRVAGDTNVDLKPGLPADVSFTSPITTVASR